jgi:hypothetical protein
MAATFSLPPFCQTDFVMIVFQEVCRSRRSGRLLTAKPRGNMTSSEQCFLARNRAQMRDRVREPGLFSVIFFRAVLRKEFVGFEPDKFLP